MMTKRRPTKRGNPDTPRITLSMARAILEKWRSQTVDYKTYAAQMRRHIGLDRHRN
jgi:hypothetical protein